MNRMLTLLALVINAAAMLALPGAASAQEIHVEGPTTFVGTGGPTKLAATGEPTITCESVDVTNGAVFSGGTTGAFGFDYTGCHATVLGFTVKCHTTGSASDNTIQSFETFHLITYGSSKPAMLVTPSTTEIICASISNTHVEGNGVIGTITSPACGTASVTMGLSFAATGSTQNHSFYTAAGFDLKTKTSGGSTLTAGLSLNATLTMGELGKLNCT